MGWTGLPEVLVLAASLPPNAYSKKKKSRVKFFSMLSGIYKKLYPKVIFSETDFRQEHRVMKRDQEIGRNCPFPDCIKEIFPSPNRKSSLDITQTPLQIQEL